MRTIALLSLPSIALAAVTLANFPPVVPDSDLSSACKSLYHQQIAHCDVSDFINKEACSKACVYALNDLTDDVIASCSNQGITGQNILVAYLNHDGVGSLCPGSKALLAAGGESENSAQSTQQQATAADSTTQQATTKATSQTQTTSQAKSTVLTSTKIASSLSAGSSSVVATDSATRSVLPPSSLTSAVASGAQITDASRTLLTTPAPIASPSSSSTPLLNYDTSSSPSGGGFSSAPTSTSSSVSGQYSDDRSGGGSPFDTQGNMASAASVIFAPAAVTIVLTMMAMCWTHILQL
ncbi:hypothetical protein B0A50_07106 [Salinomyces thailandicus]|uniref:Extracellular membrane protein CFEM domain-containing protein n=1 Tax=Salinomyces thailandicus TaxID=706561 RepID=A0A4U0TNF5_9PEZI|nr:hypothetical protein B0A50_07106 [Salinomyces thailandica]